ncbi:hypothetical protein F4808DRAFT_465142 [Astrocystis sublimbata]|nr:hypothetical protein F4808DRAFT_466113 [Astrocystis sublimbata]KAI0192161.1 hypothetical protein F4808DRAFT_465136 [Astrocystis sublimbata]KAI0192166.1 hypothetical protein F4808DRAFT_465141 [Astrocystis sublimbata]KAI0192167.1 hypothetical protein F4808DRAFT_465142 [Astrocystis sublimbata]
MESLRARSEILLRGQSWIEEEIYAQRVSWALCFFSHEDDPQSAMFQPPHSGFLRQQSVAVYIPYQFLHAYAEHQVHAQGTVVVLQHRTAHCLLKVFKCDQFGQALRWFTDFRVYWDGDYPTDHFKFVGELMPNGRRNEKMKFPPGNYFIQSQFFKAQGESRRPDAEYISGMFEVFSYE